MLIALPIDNDILTRISLMELGLFAKEAMMHEGDLLTIGQVARRLGYTSQHTRLLIRRGKLRGTKMGRDWVVAARSVEEFLSRRADQSDLHGAEDSTEQASDHAVQPTGCPRQDAS